MQAIASNGKEDVAATAQGANGLGVGLFASGKLLQGNGGQAGAFVFELTDHQAGEVRGQTGYQPPADGLHYRWPDLPSLSIETRLAHKLDAARAFARVNSIDRRVIDAPRATLGIVTCGKAHFDLLEVFRRLDLSFDTLAAAGVRLY